MEKHRKGTNQEKTYTKRRAKDKRPLAMKRAKGTKPQEYEIFK